MTVNGRIPISRRRYAAAGVGSTYPRDAWLDHAEDSISLGLREMACRLNLASANFDKAAENVGRAAQIHLSGEFLRQIVESEGRAVQAVAWAGKSPLDWKAKDCPALDKEQRPTQRSRVYLGSDGVMVPQITDKEKRTRASEGETSALRPEAASVACHQHAPPLVAFREHLEQQLRATTTERQVTGTSGRTDWAQPRGLRGWIPSHGGRH